MGRPQKYSRPELAAVVTLFEDTTGKFPSRDDFKGERRAHYERILGRPIPHAITFERYWGSWDELRTEFGIPRNKNTPSEVAERESVRHAIDKLGMIPAEGETGVVDGYIDGESVEVKGARLTRSDGNSGSYRFRWMLHNREFSKLVDRLVCVGLSAVGEVLVVVELRNRSDLFEFADNKKTMDLSVLALKGERGSIYFPFVTSINPKLLTGEPQDFL